jgi:hypothetical protein
MSSSCVSKPCCVAGGDAPTSDRMTVGDIMLDDDAHRV